MAVQQKSTYKLQIMCNNKPIPVYRKKKWLITFKRNHPDDALRRLNKQRFLLNRLYVCTYRLATSTLE